MRLGFNWPRGPLELTELIGAERAVGLLEELRSSTATPMPRRRASLRCRAVTAAGPEPPSV